MAAARQSIMISPPARLRLRSSRSGVIGWAVRCSITTNATSRAAPTANEAIVTPLPQPAAGSAAWMNPYTRLTRPRVEVSAPGRSKVPGCRSDSLM